MPSKLSRYSEGIIEAAWLAALILTPLFFNVYSARIFEPDKLSLLRSIALIIAGAWLVKIFETSRQRSGPAENWREWFRSLMRVPLAAPVAAFLSVYLIATLFSVAPAVSLWGSYQRLQGTYTTLSYLVVFAAVAVHLRRHAQVERLITTVILTSLPVSLYAILQRYNLDPVPWGGDVIERVAGNMGNAIFLAAYLIMVSPLTLVRIFNALGAVMHDPEDRPVHMVRATSYIFIAALQLVALFFTGSRGPWLGWMAGMFFLFVLFALSWGKRKLIFAILGVALLAGAFIVVMNIPNSILEPLREDPQIGRLGHLLDAEVDTGRVRVLIWEGAANLISPHEPLEYPDGRKDPFNVIRPLIGYGPESMYVAFNPFYPPELAHWERRNASPDRSHNETWDAFVMTGALGLAVYLTLFGAVFYYGLKWLGLVAGPRQRNLYVGLYLAGGVLGAAALVAWRGIAYFGIGLPFGMIAGLLVYLTGVALFGKYQPPRTRGEALRAAVIIGLLAAIVAHFAEIHFGIAIASTRTYFWIYSALMLVVGYILPGIGEYGQAAVGLSDALDGKGMPGEAQVHERPPARETNAGMRTRQSQAAGRKKRPSHRQPASSRSFRTSPWLRQAAIPAFLTTVILSTLAYNYATSALGGGSVWEVIGSSLTRLQSHNGAVSYGILALVAVTWIIVSIVGAAESWLTDREGSWLRTTAAVLGASFVLGGLFWLWHSFSLMGLMASSAQQFLGQVSRYESLLARYEFYLLALGLAAAAFLPLEWPATGVRTGTLGVLVAPVILLVVLAAVVYTNLRVVQADIVYKLADPFTRANSWDGAVALYNRANELAPAEDYYYLFLGRAYLEQAKSIEEESARDRLFQQAANDLETAQKLHPLNTDHTANLARLYSLWSNSATDPADKLEKARASDAFFERALTLSPNNVRLWGEWALLYMNSFGEDQRAEELLTASLEIDDRYDWTHALIGDLYMRQSYQETDSSKREEALRQAETSYALAMELVDPTDTTMQYNYSIALANTYENLEDPLAAVRQYQLALSLQPQGESTWQIDERIARLYQAAGDLTNARGYAQRALEGAPEDQKPRLQILVDELGREP